MRQQLDRQKNSIQNKLLDPGRQSGHYNPYTCQYVPAPKPSMNSLGEESWKGSILSSGCSNSRADTHLQSSIRGEEDNFKRSMQLVDDEWLMTGEEEYLEDDEWDMESLEGELESPEEDNQNVTIVDNDWNDFDSPNVCATTAHQVSKGAMNFVKKSSSRVQKAKVQTAVTGASIAQQKSPPSKSRSATKALTVMSGRSQPQSELQSVGGVSQPLLQPLGTQNQSAGVATPPTKAPTHQGSALRKVKHRNSNTSCESAIPSTALITDSPEPDCVLRKRSGQSIYKAPGSKPDSSR